MLLSLSIRNVVLIDYLDIDFDNGLVVLSGETGSGKSILLDALGLAIGARDGAVQPCSAPDQSLQQNSARCHGGRCRHNGQHHMPTKEACAKGPTTLQMPYHAAKIDVE